MVNFVVVHLVCLYAGASPPVCTVLPGEYTVPAALAQTGSKSTNPVHSLLLVVLVPLLPSLLLAYTPFLFPLHAP